MVEKKVGTIGILEPGGKRVLRLLEHAARGGNTALAGFQIVAPDGGCFSLHNYIWLMETEVRSPRR